MDGSNVTTIVQGDISEPADHDLAIDWIHDKLYWSDSSRKTIEEVDLNSLQRRVVVQLGQSSNPQGLAVYPMEEHGILYWTDNGHRNLQRIITNGSSHAVIHQNLHCVQPLALDYRKKMVYWSDYC